MGPAPARCEPPSGHESVPADREINLDYLAGPAFRLFSLAYFLRWLPMATQAFYTAIERPKPASVFSLFSVLVAPLAALVLLQPLGLNGLWLNLPAATLASTIVAAVMLVRLRRELRGEA